MKKQSPIGIQQIRLCPLSHNDIALGGDKLHLLEFDNRHDFVIDKDFAGIALKCDFLNYRINDCERRGVNRRIQVSVTDMTARCEFISTSVRVTMSKDTENKVVYLPFSHSEFPFEHNHTYRLMVRDELSSTLLETLFFHIYSEEALGHPEQWYTVENGGILKRSSEDVYRSVEAAAYSDLKIRFLVDHSFEDNLPTILPELEVRVHYPNGEYVEVDFVEPTIADYCSYVCEVAIPFSPRSYLDMNYYVELLCMEYPIAGFAFSTHGPEVRGDWYGEDLKPLDEYSQEAVEARMLRVEPKKEPEADEETSDEKDSIKEDIDDFDSLLDQFIASQMDGANDSNTEDTEADSTPDAAEEEQEEENVPMLKAMENLTGLHAVKRRLDVYEKVVMFNKKRIECGLPSNDVPLHAMFLGSPGTGKTTVAKLMGQMLRRAGILSSGHVVVKERATLMGPHYSDEETKTLEAIEEAQGGILLIDEAYQLHQPDDPKDPGRFVIETLLTALADESKRDWMLILCGYPDRMLRMFEMNPGFKSRIPESNIYTFDDFTSAELMEIAERYLERQQYSLSDDARAALTCRLEDDFRHKTETFGNARHVLNLIKTDIIPAMAVRLDAAGADGDKAALSEIKGCDIPKPAARARGMRRSLGFH